MNKKPKLKADEVENHLQEIEKQYRVDDPAGLIFIGQAREALKRLRQAQTAIERDGITVTDRYGQIKMNPAATVEKNSRIALFKALASLRLDFEPLRDAAGRPPGK